MAITFKELKQYISRTARISICFSDGHYDNYTMISDIEEGRYDDMYVYGIGMEALSKERIQEIFGNVGHVGMNDTSLMQQMVIVLTKEPREDVE